MIERHQNDSLKLRNKRMKKVTVKHQKMRFRTYKLIKIVEFLVEWNDYSTGKKIYL